VAAEAGTGHPGVRPLRMSGLITNVLDFAPRARLDAPMGADSLFEVEPTP